MIAKTGLSGHTRPDPQHQEWRHGEALNAAGRWTFAIRSPAALRFEPQCRISSLKFTQHFLGRWLIGSTRVDIENSSSSICRWTNRRLRGWAGGPRSCIGWLSTETCMFQVPTDQSLASPLPLPLRNPKSAPYRHTYRLPSLLLCVVRPDDQALSFQVTSGPQTLNKFPYASCVPALCYFFLISIWLSCIWTSPNHLLSL